MSFEKFINEANEAVEFSLKKLDIKNETYNLTEPTREEFGDFVIENFVEEYAEFMGKMAVKVKTISAT